MSTGTDKLAADIAADLSAINAEEAALTQQIADRDAQIATLNAQIAALSAAKPFLHVTITSGQPPHAKFEFFNGQVIEKDFPSEGDLSFNFNLDVA